jgi:hypothetical protein
MAGNDFGHFVYNYFTAQAKWMHKMNAHRRIAPAFFVTKGKDVG